MPLSRAMRTCSSQFQTTAPQRVLVAPINPTIAPPAIGLAGLSCLSLRFCGGNLLLVVLAAVEAPVMGRALAAVFIA